MKCANKLGWPNTVHYNTYLIIEHKGKCFKQPCLTLVTIIYKNIL